MAVTPANIGWSSYGNNEGPFFGGRQPYVLPANPSDDDKVMLVITAAEGGHYDAINMYDSGIVSVGLIQWIDAGQHSVDNMLGRVCEDCGLDVVLNALQPALDLSGATFKQDPQGAWRFFNAGGEVVTNSQLHQLFMKGAGPKGSWTDDAKLHAKTWAACLANVWADEGARKAQIAYTVPKLKDFLASDVRSALYDSQHATGWVGAVRATMVHYGVNLPAYVANAFRNYHSTAAKWSADWSIGLIKAVTFAGPQPLWAVRYNSIRPVLEAQYGITLPKNSAALAAWKPTGDNTFVPVPFFPPIPPEPVPTPAPQPQPQPEPEPPAPQPEPPQPGPIVPVNPTTPAWKSIVDFIMMLFNLFFKRGK